MSHPLMARYLLQELFYSDRGFDRAAEKRTEAEWLSNAHSDPATKVLPVWDRKSLVRDGRAVILQYTQVLGEIDQEGWTPEPIFLGQLKEGDHKEAVFALDVTGRRKGR